MFTHEKQKCVQSLFQICNPAYPCHYVISSCLIVEYGSNYLKNLWTMKTVSYIMYFLVSKEFDWFLELWSIANKEEAKNYTKAISKRVCTKKKLL